MSSSISLLLHLPTELLEAIVSFVDPASLAPLTRVCQTLQQLVEPQLYHTVSLRNRESEHFVRAIDRIPSRAKYVRELQVHYHDVNGEETDYPLQVEALSPTIFQLQNLESLIVKGPDEDPMSLGLGRYMEESRKFQGLFLQAASPHSKALQSLRSCTINLSEQQNWELAQLDGLFLHPTLQCLTIVNARMASFTSFDSSRERSTGLRELTLITCDIRPDQLHQILSLAKALERFTTKGSAWQGRSVSGEDRVANLDSLRMHISSLLALDLDFFFDVDWPPLQPLTLVEFSVLRQLAIELWVVRQHIEQGIVSQKELLPQGLEELTLKCAGQHVELESYYLDPVYHWLQEGALPNLKRLTLETTAPVPNVPDTIFQGNQTVRQAFSGCGVEISMMEEAPGGHIPFDCPCCWYRYRNPGWMPGWF